MQITYHNENPARSSKGSRGRKGPASKSATGRGPGAFFGRTQPRTGLRSKGPTSQLVPCPPRPLAVPLSSPAGPASWSSKSPASPSPGGPASRPLPLHPPSRCPHLPQAPVASPLLPWWSRLSLSRWPRLPTGRPRLPRSRGALPPRLLSLPQ